MLRFKIEVWYWLEEQTGRLWNRLCPSDKASFWLDFLPAFCTRKRYAAQNAFVKKFNKGIYD